MFPRKRPLRAMQVKPKMAAVFRTLNSFFFFFFFFRTLNSSDWLVYGLAFMFASTLPASRHFYPSCENLGRVSVYALKVESWQSVYLRS